MDKREQVLEAKPHTVQFTIPLDGKVLDIRIPFYLVSPQNQNAPVGPQPVLVERAFPPTILKLMEAHHYFEKVLSVLHNELLLRFALNAFLSALRSVTWVLQKEAHDLAGFADWYEKRQQEMKADPTLKKVVELRNVAEKLGSAIPEISLSVMVRRRKEGGLEVGALMEGFRIDGHDFTLSHCHDALTAISEVVSKAGEAGFLQVKPENRNINFLVKTVREHDDGSWHYFSAEEPEGAALEPEVKWSMDRSTFHPAVASTSEKFDEKKT